MSDQPSEQKKSADPTRNCNALINWVWVTILVIWIGWGFLLPLALTFGAGAAENKAQQSHPHDDMDNTYYDLTADVVRTALASAGACIVLPTTLLLIVIWLQLRRLRKRIAQDL